MSAALKRFIGKDCIITTMNSSITGTVESLEDNWLSIRQKSNLGDEGNLVNVDYISQIREYPRNKKGKRKAIVT